MGHDRFSLSTIDCEDVSNPLKQTVPTRNTPGYVQFHKGKKYSQYKILEMDYSVRLGFAHIHTYMCVCVIKYTHIHNILTDITKVASIEVTQFNSHQMCIRTSFLPAPLPT